ncbi:MAG: sodium:solute symporter [Bacteroidales bacterium]
MNGIPILAILAGYFAMLIIIARLTSKNGSNEAFFSGNRQSPWWLVAIGMIGTSISGVTFVSVPGMTSTIGMTYMQMVLGFAVGYIIIARLLLPLYYKLNLISIYKYLGERFGQRSYKTGALFFIISKITGAAARLFLVVLILQTLVADTWGIPFWATSVIIVALIWTYSRRSGIQTIVRTDALQAVILITALVLIIYGVIQSMGTGFMGSIKMIAESPDSRIFVFDDWRSTQNFFKQFLSGIFITIVMTGLDQDMMQKNLTISTLKASQKNMYIYGSAFIPINLLFLSLGVLLMYFAASKGIVLPKNGDEILPLLATNYLGVTVLFLFCIGIIAAAFSSADSALTSLTTSFCIDILDVGKMPEQKSLNTRKTVHLAMCAAFVSIVLIIHGLNNTSVIDAIYTMAGYTYGPLLGLFAYGLFTKGVPNDKTVPYITIASPILCAIISYLFVSLFNYKLGYELLILNGVLTFTLLAFSARNKSCKSLTP